MNLRLEDLARVFHRDDDSHTLLVSHEFGKALEFLEPLARNRVQFNRIIYTCLVLSKRRKHSTLTSPRHENGSDSRTYACHASSGMAIVELKLI